MLISKVFLDYIYVFCLRNNCDKQYIVILRHLNATDSMLMA